MNTFECRMVDHDGDDEWTVVKALDAEDAASNYGSVCHDRSGGETLCSESDEEIVVVCDENGDITKWRVTLYISYSFPAYELENEDA